MTENPYLVGIAVFIKRLMLLALVASVIAWHFDVSFAKELKDTVAAFCENSTAKGLLIIALIYMLLLVLPFVPGVELGLMMMLILGKTGIVLVYGCTVAALLIGFFLGRVVICPRVFRDANHAFISARRGKFGVLKSNHLPMAQVLLRRPYVLVAILFNMPGNTVLGGGGGIAMLSGASGVMQWPQYLLTVMIAVCPVPLLAWLGLISF